MNILNNNIDIIQHPWCTEFVIAATDDYTARKITCGEKWSHNGRYHGYDGYDRTIHVLDGDLNIEVYTDEGIFNLQLPPGHSYTINARTYIKFKSNTPKCTFLEVTNAYNLTKVCVLDEI